MRLVRQSRTEGEGRTMSGLPHATARSKRGLTFTAAWLLVLVCASIRFTMDTASVGRADSGAIVALSAIFTGILVLFVHRPHDVVTQNPLAGRAVVGGSLVAAASAITFAGVPWVVFLNRSSDAPPGAVVAFWTTSFVGSLLAAGAAIALPDVAWRSRLPRAAAALVLMTAGAGVMTNWERPSSFSLLVRYTGPQIAMMVAGMAWVALILMLTTRIRSVGWPSVYLPAALGCFIGGAAVLVLDPGAWASITSPIVLLAAGAFAVLHLVVLSLGPGQGALLSGTAIAAAPAAITLLAILEAAVGMLGPRPLLIAPVAGASLLGAMAVWLILGRLDTGHYEQLPALRIAALGALASASVGMFAPALGVAIEGGLSDGQAFTAQFSMAGFETVAGWVAFSVALTTTAALFAPTGYRQLLAVVSIGAAAVIAWLLLRPMPLHTWVSWIPPEVQQDYGTEFASIVFTPLDAIWQPLGLIIAVLSAAGAAILARTGARPEALSEPSMEKDRS